MWLFQRKAVPLQKNKSYRNMAKRKIGFYYLFLKQNEVEMPIEANLLNVLAFLELKSRVERKQDISNDRFAFLDSYSHNSNQEQDFLELLFKSAKHSYRAPLLDKNTVEERENPKTMAEGEQMKTHAIVKFKEGDAILFLETGNGMLTCANIVDYLNKAISFYNAQFDNEDDKIIGRFTFDMIPRDDFREVLQGMTRVVCAEIFVDKVLLGSDALDFSEPSEEIKEEVIVKVQAGRKKTIKEHVYDFLDKYNGTYSHIKRIRVRGKMSNENEGIIDTGRIIKKEYVDAQQNEDTGDFNSTYMFTQLSLLSQDF